MYSRVNKDKSVSLWQFVPIDSQAMDENRLDILLSSVANFTIQPTVHSIGPSINRIEINFSENVFLLIKNSDAFKDQPILESKNFYLEAACYYAGEKFLTRLYDTTCYSEEHENGLYYNDMGSTRRLNHGVCHSIRTTFLLQELIDMLKLLLPDQYQQNHYLSEEKNPAGFSYNELTRIAMLFCVTGRKNELGWRPPNKTIEDLCANIKNRIYAGIKSQKEIENFGSEWVKGDYFELMINEYFTYNDYFSLPCAKSILQEGVDIINKNPINRESLADYDKYIQVHHPLLYKDLVELTNKSDGGSKTLRNCYKKYPGMMIAHYQIVLTQKQDERITERLKQFVTDAKEKPLLEEEIYKEKMNNWTYNLFREASAANFMRFCQDSGLTLLVNSEQEAFINMLYRAIRFMGNPSHYSASALRKPSHDMEKTLCSLLSIAHNADLSRCFKDGKNQPHFEALCSALQQGFPPEQQKYVRSTVINFYRYVSRYQTATHDRCLEAMNADGKFRPHDTIGTFGPEFFLLSNSAELTLNVLQKMPPLFKPQYKFPVKSTGIHYEKNSHIVDIYFKKMTDIPIFVKAQQLKYPHLKALGILETAMPHNGGHVKISFMADDFFTLEESMTYEKPDIPTVFSLEPELYNTTEFSWEVAIKQEKALQRLLSTHQNQNKEYPFDFDLATLTNPTEMRGQPRTKPFLGQTNYVSIFGRSTKSNRKKYDYVKDQWDVIPIVNDLRESPLITSRAQAENIAQLPKKSRSVPQAPGTKNTVFQRKTFYSICTTEGLCNHPIEAGFGMLFNSDYCNLKGEKYLFLKDAWGDRHLYQDNNTHENQVVQQIKELKNISCHVTSLKELHTKLPSQLEEVKQLKLSLSTNISPREKKTLENKISVAYTDIYASASMVGARAFFSNSNKIILRITAALHAARANKLYGFDLPVIIHTGEAFPHWYQEKQFMQDLKIVMVGMLHHSQSETLNYFKNIVDDLIDNKSILNAIYQNLSQLETYDKGILQIIEAANLLQSSSRAIKILTKTWSTLNDSQKEIFIINQIRFGNLNILLLHSREKIQDFANNHPSVKTLFDNYHINQNLDGTIHSFEIITHEILQKDSIQDIELAFLSDIYRYLLDQEKEKIFHFVTTKLSPSEIQFFITANESIKDKDNNSLVHLLIMKAIDLHKLTEILTQWSNKNKYHCITSIPSTLVEKNLAGETPLSLFVNSDLVSVNHDFLLLCKAIKSLEQCLGETNKKNQSLLLQSILRFNLQLTDILKEKKQAASLKVTPENEDELKKLNCPQGIALLEQFFSSLEKISKPDFIHILIKSGIDFSLNESLLQKIFFLCKNFDNPNLLFNILIHCQDFSCLSSELFLHILTFINHHPDTNNAINFATLKRIRAKDADSLPEKKSLSHWFDKNIDFLAKHDPQQMIKIAHLLQHPALTYDYTIQNSERDTTIAKNYFIPAIIQRSLLHALCEYQMINKLPEFDAPQIEKLPIKFSLFSLFRAGNEGFKRAKLLYDTVLLGDQEAIFKVITEIRQSSSGQILNKNRSLKYLVKIYLAAHGIQESDLGKSYSYKKD